MPNVMANSWTKAGVILFLVAVVLIKWALTISERRVSLDDGDNIRMAYNLVHHGVISVNGGGSGPDSNPEPTNYREPLPAFVLAATMKALEAVQGPRDPVDYVEGPGARVLKISNFFWGLVLCASVFAAIHIFTQSIWLASAGWLFAGLRLEVDRFLTEPAAAALIALFSFFAVRAVKNGNTIDYGMAGMVFGALILTKAAFLYVGFALIPPLLFLLLAKERNRSNGISCFLKGFFMLGGVLLVIAPWSARNYVLLGSPQITQRAGIVLMTRAIKNNMTPTEYVGSFYVWAPSGLGDAFGFILGFGPDDLKKGGRLQRLNRHESDFQDEDLAAEKAGRPEDAVSYYRKARAERTKLTREFQAQGDPNARPHADAELQKRAADLILADPIRHIATTLPFVWRGAFYEAPLLLWFAVLALIWRRPDMLAYVLPSLAMVAFYALASHNIPRYNDPVFPLAAAALLIFGFEFLMRRNALNLHPRLHAEARGV